MYSAFNGNGVYLGGIDANDANDVASFCPSPAPFTSITSFLRSIPEQTVQTVHSVLGLSGLSGLFVGGTRFLRSALLPTISGGLDFAILPVASNLSLSNGVALSGKTQQ